MMNKQALKSNRGYDLSPLAHILDEVSTPQELSGFLDTVEEKLLSYTLNDESIGGPTGIESEWYYLRQLRKAMEQISMAEWEKELLAKKNQL